MAVIRADRRAAGFTEVTVWLPEELARSFRDRAWKAIDTCRRLFPHRASTRDLVKQPVRKSAMSLREEDG